MSNTNATRVSGGQSRRAKTSKPGIYYRDGKDGRRRYEYVVRDVDGKQRWFSGFEKIADAEADRAEKQRRTRGGERVARVRQKFGDFAEQWLASKTAVRESTRLKYEWAIRHHLSRFAARKLGEIRPDDVALLIADMKAEGYKPGTIKAVVMTLSLVLSRAQRQGAIATNPVLALERDERPAGAPRPMRILQRDEVQRLLEASSDAARPLLATLVFCGLRISEALGLVWADVDFESQELRVRYQLDHITRQRGDLKTTNAARNVVVMPALARLLREYRLKSRYSGPGEWVFASTAGTPLQRDNVRHRLFSPAVDAAGLNGPGVSPLRLHDLRHTYASMLIAGGATVVYVSRQMGHGSPAITLGTYSHLFDAKEHAERTAAMLESQWGQTLAQGGATGQVLRLA